MATHRFKVGTAVSLNAEGRSLPSSSRYIVEAQLPPVGAFLQYRIKSEGEGFRRVVVEHQIDLLGATPAPAQSAVPRPHHGEED